MNVFGDSTINTVHHWLRGLSGRQSAIADNIANIDTPGYRRREVSFETELARALNTNGARLTTTSPGHVSHSRLGGGLGMDQTQMLSSMRADGNDVDIDQEMVLLVETQLRYQAATRALNSRFDQIRNVIGTT
jgi:flagellar basal-body rod protein FlgB